MLTDDSIQAMGGRARAEALSSEERKKIAANAAEARWSAPKATHKGELTIGTVTIPCAVLENGKRVLSENGITNAMLGSRSGASKRLKKAAQTDGALLPLFLAPGQLNSLIDNALRDGPLVPLTYLDGRSLVVGYDAELLPAVCDIWLKARELGLLRKDQLEKAQRAENLMRALAHVGITALIDEATGYQEVRDKAALAKILERYLATEARKWERMFQIDYYRELFRLQGWTFNPDTNARTPYLGKITNNVIYDRLQPGILKKLNALNPPIETSTGKKLRRHTFHSFFTGDIGVPELKEHLSNVTILMKVSKDWENFIDMLDKVKPRLGDTLKLPLEFADDKKV